MPLLAGDIREMLAPFRLLTNKAALSATYKTLLLLPDRVCGCSSHGMLEISMELGLEEEAMVDAHSFLSLLDSLPKTGELLLVVDNGVMLWGCGNAKGRMALAALERLPRIETDVPKKNVMKPPSDFSAALKLGALSCDSMSLASLGLHGVVLHLTQEGVNILSSDNVTVSHAYSPFAKAAGPKADDMAPVTLSPQSVAVLASVIAEGGLFAVTPTELRYWDEGTDLLLRQVAPLKRDLLELCERFDAREDVTAIPQDAIAAFLKRTTAMSEEKRDTVIQLKAGDGKLALEFTGSTSSADEYYLVEGLELEGEVEINLDASRLARGLAHIEYVGLDYVAKGALLFFCEAPDFTYLVSGKK